MPEHTTVPLTAGHIDECVRLHRQAFPTFFLSQLGPRFLSEFYRAFLDDPDAVTGVALDGRGDVQGVVVGTTRPGGFFSRLLKRRWYAFALASLALVVRRPSAIPRLLRAVRYRGGVPLEVEGALLSSICVAPSGQGHGVGSLLLGHFEGVVRSAGLPAYLVTDRSENEAGNGFYVHNGWRRAGSYETPEGRTMNCYVLDIPEEAK